ncbi:hypothetical protein BDY19DRAFT_888870 [Irpex rosettiformis]|uniref:Uncharacterized protein n=1 Tax=Irpex rosettiformis TaxID=378272 RepID=A0ACB8U682_9APHY|nr:hypothetical protein BDY19DRAFT_888870 [Irpex rosettiformis]
MFLLTRQELVALSIFISYFLIIISLFVLIGRSLWRKSEDPRITSEQRKKAMAFRILSGSSFGSTWYSMIAFLVWSFRDFEANHYTDSSQYALDGLTRLTAWLMNSELFEQAWSTVCSGPMNWWWSEKLCLFTVGYWTVFLATEGRTHKVPHLWAYMLLGQVVAISVAANLFYVALILFTVPAPIASKESPKERSRSTPWTLWLSVTASLITIFLSPYTTPATFLPNLLVMHTLIIVPLIFPLITSNSSKTPQRFNTWFLYGFVVMVSLVLHAGTTITAFASVQEGQRTVGEFARKAMETFNEHPAQKSICWDVVWTYVSLAAWKLWPSTAEKRYAEKKVG